MIIGGSKKEVIKNIETNINNNELNKKVEVGDPNLTEEEKTKYINKFYQNQKSPIYFIAIAYIENICLIVKPCIKYHVIMHIIA